jgi:nicotinamide mononucleotide transporter PnuC
MFDIQWDQIFWDEWSFVAFATGFFAVLLITFARWPNLSWWNWPLGLVSTILYTWILYDAELYASAGLNAFFAISALYGMWAWKYGGKDHTPLPIRLAPARVYLVGLGFVVVFTGIAYFTLDTWTDNPEPFWDALFVGVSITAQFIMTRRYLEHWYLWIVSDLIAVPLYLSQDLGSLALLYLVYGIICVYPGLVEWYRSYRLDTPQNISPNPLIPSQTGVSDDITLDAERTPSGGPVVFRTYGDT